MKEVFFVSNENKNKALEILKKDEILSRGSIITRSASNLGIEKEGYFIIIDVKDVERAKELLKNIAEPYEKRDEIISKIKKEEENAIQGFGSIFG